MKNKYHHGDLRNELIHASLLILKEEGYRALSLRKAAKRAGVSQAAPYRHYEDIETLYAEVAGEGFRLLMGKLEKIKKKFSDKPLLQFREAGVGYIDFAYRNPDLFQIMYGNQIHDHSRYEFLIELEIRTFHILEEILQTCQDGGWIDVGNIQSASASAWAMVHGAATLLCGNQVMFQNQGLNGAR